MFVGVGAAREGPLRQGPGQGQGAEHHFKEEARTLQTFGDEYRACRARVPMLVPRLGQWRQLLDETRWPAEEQP